MKQKIAIMLTILMAVGSMSACGEKEDTVRKTAAADKAVAVSVYREITSEMTTAETAPVTEETTLPTYEPTEETKADTKNHRKTKADNPLLWLQRMNNIQNQAKEIVYAEVIFV